MGSKQLNKVLNTTMKSVVLILVSASMCLAQSSYPVDNEIPQPYEYQYGVKDDYSKTNFAKTESQDAQGNVKGTYVIALPDGRIQTTSYTADPINGYVADVTYQGEPVYPDPPQQPRPVFTAA